MPTRSKRTVTQAPSLTPSTLPAETVVLRGAPVNLNTEVGQAFVRDCARHTEGLVSDRDIQSKYGLSDVQWAALADNTPLLDRVRRERERRVFTGAAAQEGAQLHFARAPNVLGSILKDGSVSPRHRIDAARELRHVAIGQEADDTHDKEKFVVIINLGSGEEPIRIEKEIEHRSPTESDNGEDP